MPKYWTEHTVGALLSLLDEKIHAFADATHHHGPRAKVEELEQMLALRKRLRREWERQHDRRLIRKGE